MKPELKVTAMTAPPEQKYENWVKTVNICHAKGWKAVNQDLIFQSPSGFYHDLSAADLDKLDEIERKNSFVISQI